MGECSDSPLLKRVFVWGAYFHSGMPTFTVKPGCQYLRKYRHPDAYIHVNTPGTRDAYFWGCLYSLDTSVIKFWGPHEIALPPWALISQCQIKSCIPVNIVLQIHYSLVNDVVDAVFHTMFTSEYCILMRMYYAQFTVDVLFLSN